MDSSVHSIYNDPSDLRSLILIPIIPKERTLKTIAAVPFSLTSPSSLLLKALHYKTKTTLIDWDGREYQTLNGNTVDVNEIYDPPPPPFKSTNRIAELKIRFPTQRSAF